MVATVSLQEREAIFSTLRKIFSNIIQHPNDDKYRRIKLAGKTFSSKVWQYPGSEELMKICGWVVEGEHISLRDDSQVEVALGIMLQVSGITTLNQTK